MPKREAKPDDEPLEGNIRTEFIGGPFDGRVLFAPRGDGPVTFDAKNAEGQNIGWVVYDLTPDGRATFVDMRMKTAADSKLDTN